MAMAMAMAKLHHSRSSSLIVLLLAASSISSLLADLPPFHTTSTSFSLRLVASRGAESSRRHLTASDQIKAIIEREGTSRRMAATRRRHLSASSTNETEGEEFRSRLVSGSSFPGTIGQYFAELYVGTPRKAFNMVVDTGSDVMWLPCELCEGEEGCKDKERSSPSPVFIAKASSTCKEVKCPSKTCYYVPPPEGAKACNAMAPTSCTFAYSYHDGTKTSGVFVLDTVQTSIHRHSFELPNIAFGCSTQHHDLVSSVGGILGLGRGPISFSSQLSHSFDHHSFSYCFTSFFHKDNISSSLIFGSPSRLLPPLQYTPFIDNPFSIESYYLSIVSVLINGFSLHIPSHVWSFSPHNGYGGTMIDSGTTLTYFRKPAYDAIVSAIAKAMPYPTASPTAGLDVCYNVSGFGLPRLPSLSIVFAGGAVFSPPANNYFLRPKQNLRCLGFMEASIQSANVLGNLLQQNFHVEYDRRKNRLGFAKARCASPSMAAL